MLLDLLIGAGVALLVSLVACRLLMAAGPLDVPDAARKAHAAPTPTGAGVGMALGFAAGLMVLALFLGAVRNEMSAQGVQLLSIGAFFAFSFMAIGFVDDARPLGPRFKFALFSLLSLGAAFSLGVVDTLPLGGGELKLGFTLGLAGTALWMFTFVNVVNFMDGANGLAIGSVAVGLVVLGVIAAVDGTAAGAAASFCGAGALIGFLFWNYPNGRIFAGDSGALFSGAVAALASLIVIHRTELSPFVPPILFFPLIADALLTLGWRVTKRRRLLVGHAEHFYQIAIRSGWPHWRITLLYWAAMAGCGAIGFAASRAPESPAPWIALAALCGLALAVSALVRRYAAARGFGEH